jgi:hypothetical protein
MFSEKETVVLYNRRTGFQQWAYVRNHWTACRARPELAIAVRFDVLTAVSMKMACKDTRFVTWHVNYDNLKAPGISHNKYKTACQTRLAGSFLVSRNQIICLDWQRRENNYVNATISWSSYTFVYFPSKSFFVPLCDFFMVLYFIFRSIILNLRVRVLNAFQCCLRFV